MLQWEEKPAFFSTTWEKANNYAKCLGDGWRLPTRSELLQAYDNKVQGFEPDDYWSSSTYAQNTNGAWYVDFDDGGVYYSGKASHRYVRCVREIR